MKRITFWRVSAIVLLTASLMAGTQRASLASDEHHATPAPGCAVVATPAEANADAHAGMQMATPAMTQDIDLLYIDMMIPHHASIIAMAQVALESLHDERLRVMAQDIVTTQTAEIDQLKAYRLQLFGDAEPQPLGEHGMMLLMGDQEKPMDAMMTEMNAAAQVAAFCSAADPDLAFIALATPHHASAIVASEAVLAQGTHPEIRAIAEQVIAAQQREIAELQQIQSELTGTATPAAAG